MSSLTPLQLWLEPMVPGLSAADTLTARADDPWCHSVTVVNALRTVTPFAGWEVVTPAIPAAAIPPPAPTGAVPVLLVPASAAAAVLAAAPPFVRIRARWLERWANLCGRQARDYKLVPFASRALSMGKAKRVLDCAAATGGLESRLVQSVCTLIMRMNLMWLACDRQRNVRLIRAPWTPSLTRTPLSLSFWWEPR